MLSRFAVSLAALALLAAGGAALPTRSLDPPAAPGAMAPSLTATGSGLLLTWLEPLDPKDKAKGHRLRFSRLASLDDARWSAPVTVASGTDFFANWADFPSAARAADGSLTVHWLAKTGEDTYAYGIFLARSTDGGATWRSAGLLHDDGIPAEHGFVSWIPEKKGLRAFWLDGRDTPKKQPMALRTALVGDRADSGERLDASVCDCCQTDAALAESGPVVAYRDRSDTEVRDVAVIRRTAKGWSEPVSVHADGWQIPGCPVNGPAVAASGRRVAVAWFTAAPPKTQVLAAFSQDGGATFGKPIEVDGDKPLGRVDLLLDADGSALVSWLALEGSSGASVRLRRVREGKAGPTLTLAATTAARSSGFPRMARWGDQIFVAWVDGGEVSRVRVVGLTPPLPTPEKPSPPGSSRPASRTSRPRR